MHSRRSNGRHTKKRRIRAAGICANQQLKSAQSVLCFMLIGNRIAPRRGKMEKFKQNYMPVEKNHQTTGKSDRTFLKVAGIVGLVMASPFIAFSAFFAIVCIMACIAMICGSMHEFAPWIFLGLMLCGFVPAIRDRITGKYNQQKLKNQIDFLQAELLEAKKHILELEEGADFHRKLAESNSKLANIDRPINVNLSVTKADLPLQR